MKDLSGTSLKNTRLHSTKNPFKGFRNGFRCTSLGSKKGAILTVLSVVVGLIVAMATIQSTQASIDYWLQKPNTLMPGLNSITVYCRNGGGMDGDFNLIVKFTNATFSQQTDLPYTLVDNSTVKIKFVLHQGDSNEKTIYFDVNQTQGFSISVSLEKASYTEFIKANALFPTNVPYLWNVELQCFSCTNPQ